MSLMGMINKQHELAQTRVRHCDSTSTKRRAQKSEGVEEGETGGLSLREYVTRRQTDQYSKSNPLFTCVH